MARKPASKTLVNAFEMDLAAAWSRFRSAHPDHRPYALVLYGTEGRTAFSPAVLTEESLAQVAQRYVDRDRHDTLDEARHALRYSVADSPLLPEAFAIGLPTVDAAFAPSAASLDETAGYAILADAGMAALAKLDKQNTFGTGADRDRLLLLIVTDGTEFDRSDESARRLNPPAAYAAYANHFPKAEGEFRTADAVTVAPGGRSLFTFTVRRDPDKVDQGEFIAELTGCDVRGTTLSRTWTHRFPVWRSDGPVGLQMSPTGDAVFVLRRSGGQTLLMSFDPVAGKPVAQVRLDGDPVTLAVSPDGDRLGALMLEGSYHLLDGQMRVLATRHLDVALRDAVFLPDGDLLVAHAEGLLRLTPDTGDVVDAWPFGRDRLRTDAGRRLVMLSWRVRSLAGARAGQPALTAGLFEWPAMTLIREIAVADHHVTRATVSPGGDRYAVEIQSVARSVSRVVVYDTDTGDEVARRRASRLRDVTFIDDRTLALAGSGTTATVPVELWNVP